MDIYGIGAAIEGFAEGYYCGARQSGRTTRMIEQVQSGDLVVCLNDSDVRHVKLHLKDRGDLKDVQVVTAKYAFGENIRCELHRVGKVYFTHGLVEDHYEKALKRAGYDLERIEYELRQRIVMSSMSPPRFTI